jgi:asparaginyl-tRNA synthetase
MKRIKIKELLLTKPEGQTVTAKGWVRTFRNNQFISLNDGSTINNLQAVVELNSVADETLKRITTGACLSVTGERPGCRIKSKGTRNSWRQRC